MLNKIYNVVKTTNLKKKMKIRGYDILVSHSALKQVGY